MNGLTDHGDARGKGAKYLRGKGPLRLVFEKRVGAKGLALSVESRIKKLSMARKEALMEQDHMINKIIARFLCALHSHRTTTAARTPSRRRR